MIVIKLPNNNISEREYVVDVIFSEFLGLNFKTKIGREDYEIILPNKRSFTIKDTFFNRFPKDLEYLKEENVPKSIDELDIFSASFFMLTRWEEYVNKNRDLHNRFPAYESLAYREGFLDRPIVDEFIKELKEKLLELDDSLVFKKREFELILTHDIDDIYFWKNKRQLFRIVLGDILKRRDIKLALKRVREYYLVSKNKMKDPFDTFDWFMDKSEDIGLKSRFYFMSRGVTEYDNRYDIKQQKQLIEHIKKRGHIIGIHPSYNAYNDFGQLKKEKELLEEICACEIKEGREHYLRFEVPTTWQIWEDNRMSIDSTCGYADKEGFRCGTGNEFSVFNILTREKLKLKERPLILMDCTLFKYNNYNYKEAIEKIEKLIRQTDTFTVLWHNSSIEHIDFLESILNKLKRSRIIKTV